MPSGIPLGPYVLVRRLATGGMAEIFLARKEGPEGFARELVVKRILPHLAEDPRFTDMFLEEARIAARLAHPNLVHVYDFGEVDEVWYLAMELIRGVDLSVLTRRATATPDKGIPPHHAAKILSFVCEGLAHAHALTVEGRPVGLVHRDVTPSNVLVSFEGAVKVADFGIAKLERPDRRELTAHGRVRGKYAYLSPEQARGQQLDARSDLFNVGILLFEALSGDTLFPHGDPVMAKRMSALGEIPRPERFDRFPPELASVVRRALAPRRDDRYPDALSLRADLEAFLRRWPVPSDTVEIGRYVREVCPDVVEEDRRGPRAAGTVPATVVVNAGSPSHDTEPDSQVPTVVRAAPTALERPPRPPTPSAESAEVTSLYAPDPGPTTEITAITPVPPPPGRPRRRMVAIWLGSAAIVGAGILTGAYLAFAGSVPDGPVVTPLGDPGPLAGAPAEPVPEEPEALAFGDVSVEGVPGAEVYLAGHYQGTTPLTLSVLAGRPQRIEVRTEETVLFDESITVEAGEERALMVEAPREGRLTVVTTPVGATVFVDGEEVGQTPLRGAHVPFGRHRVRVEHPGHVSQEQVIALGERSRTEALALVLAPEPSAPSEPGHVRDRHPAPPAEAGGGTLTINTIPWSRVYLGRRLLGTTPLHRTHLPAGTHTLTLRAEGRDPVQRRVHIQAGQETRVTFPL